MTYALTDSYRRAPNWLYIVSPDRTERRRVGITVEWSVENVRHELGVARIVAPVNAPWLVWAEDVATANFDLATLWVGWSFDYHRHVVGGRPLYSGPIIDVTIRPGQTPNSKPLVEFVCETFNGHFAQRRTHSTATKADNAYTDQSRDIVSTVYANMLSVTPTGYPGGESRTDFGPSWTVGAQSVPSAGTTITVNEQSGNEVWSFVEHVAEKDDLYLWADETSDATWSMSSAAFEDTDRTGEGWALSGRAGQLSSWSHTYTLREMANVVRVAGSGAGSGQADKWFTAGNSATYGVFEKSITLPGAAAGDTDAEGDGTTGIAARQGSPLTMVEVDVRDSGQVRFADATATYFYNVRDKINIYLEQVGITVTAVVRGYQVSQAGTGPIRTKILVSDIKPSTLKQLGTYAPLRGRYNRNRFRNLSG